MEYLTNTNDNSFSASTLQEARVNETNFEDSFGKIGKRSFLVFKHNKYLTVPTENIAFFYIKYTTSLIVSFDRQEFAVNYSLEHIEELLSGLQFYRLNRQYLINFCAVREVEHYFARKLLVNLTVPVAGKLLVSKERAKSFLQWLENR